MLFASALGDWDFSIYDELGENKKYIGILFHIIVICANMLLLLNLVIAIMSDTYANLADVKLGLYSQGIIEAMPSYKFDKHYGGLICMIPPFNILAFLLLPIYSCIGNKERLERFNKVVCKTIYFPMGVSMTLVFSVCALLLIPFAWMKVILHKCLLGRRYKKPQMYGMAIFYFLLGLPILFITAIVDSCWFFLHLYQWKMTRVQEANRYPKISLKAFNKFYYTVNQR